MNDWISVGDRLPEKTDPRPPSPTYTRSLKLDILVSTKEGRVFQTSFSSLGFANLISYTDEVLAWMPLPEPYSTALDAKEVNDERAMLRL